MLFVCFMCLRRVVLLANTGESVQYGGQTIGDGHENESQFSAPIFSRRACISSVFSPMDCKMIILNTEPKNRFGMCSNEEN